MTVTEKSLYFLLGQLLIIGVCSACFPTKCLKCNATGKADVCPLCNSTECIKDQDIPQNCTKDFQVSLHGSRSFELQEGDKITIKCVHNLPSVAVAFEWYKDGQKIKGRNESQLTLKVLTRDKGSYHCTVKSECGNYTSSPQEVTVQDSIVIILVICGVSAVLLVLALGLAMKYKLKKENADYEKRREQRAREQQRDQAQIRPRDT